MLYDTQHAHLKRPCSGKFRYGEKGQKLFLIICKPMGASVIVGLLLVTLLSCGLITSSALGALIMKKRGWAIKYM